MRLDDQVRAALVAHRQRWQWDEICLRPHAQRQFRIIRYRDLAKLANAVEREVVAAPTVTAPRLRRRRSPLYRHETIHGEIAVAKFHSVRTSSANV